MHPDGFHDLIRRAQAGEPQAVEELLAAVRPCLDHLARQGAGPAGPEGGASDLVHIGQMVMKDGGTVEDLRDTVYNYPSMGEAYRVAALNGLDKVRRRIVTVK